MELAANQKAGNEDGHYAHVLTRHLGMTGLMVFAKHETNDRIQWIKTGGVGVGLWNMGNKGAIAARIGLEHGNDVIDLTFVAAHLAPMEWDWKRRNKDFENIIRNVGMKYDERLSKEYGESSTASEADEDEVRSLLAQSGSSSPSSLYDTKGFVFVAGDLNYRTSDTPPQPEDIANFPQPDEPQESKKHVYSLLSQDQLARERKAKRTFQGFEESPIHFPPTYKYRQSDIIPVQQAGEEPLVYQWTTHRFPSWCDRILYLSTANVKVNGYKALPLQHTSDHRPVALSFSIQKTARQTEISSPYSLNPQFAEWRAAARTREIVVGVIAYLGVTREGNTILVGLLAGAFASWYVMQSMLSA